MRNLHFRRAARTSVLGTAALVAALSLTACQSGSPAAADDSAGSASLKPAAGTSAAPAADTDAKTAGNSGTSGSASGTVEDSGSSAPKQQGSDADSDSGASLPTCTGENTKLTITSVQRPVNHMLLTVTNTGSKACNAFYYPVLRFGEAQSVPPVVEDSKPQAVVTVAPGQSAYAGVMTSSADGSGTGGYSTKDLAVGFLDAESESAGDMVGVPLSKDVYVDSTLTVTYWQTEMDDALMY
ncbi:DUF4232 domain-containing protein [Streptomyces sp. QL37]|uniref:DUF4232 domain-containing protein n=1 Tax=Streptomyces sp. QL37 TaxID=2093747 RepID=UPI000CF2521F|nr:DUF4232 domain-containing protein [Streptomyces sp. QL37]PPQ58165.1 DUF4232 domain-containing protein [Streptomyces sp. QL37]